MSTPLSEHIEMRLKEGKKKNNISLDFVMRCVIILTQQQGVYLK
jgi:hypothetical protein|tara:strand:+ start:129 stop:260 length:132 start_codon:yes stop_codon:yes gene_type:complete